ncbi:hypothetical protein BOQ63_028000 [Streptomyces viridifaciens]|nr:hypothetical protein CP971_21085 [Streptomyces viridifaciens]UKZ07807.1 hypothetical protein BOQ63_028000 [Streptomyces viridifaciens]
MRNGLVQLCAWAAATGAAVALSWLGVHAVLTGAAFEQPTALPLPSPRVGGTPHNASATPDPTPTPTSQSPTQPAAAPSATTTTHAPAGTPPTGAAAPPARRPSPTATSTVRSYPIPGGRVALDIRADKASLVSATPDPGWQMQVWNGDQWMRVDFTRDNQANSVFVYWNGHPPVVETAVR